MANVTIGSIKLACGSIFVWVAGAGYGANDPKKAAAVAETNLIS